MRRSGVFLSCVNSNCQSGEFIMVLPTVNLDAALSTADLLNKKEHSTSRCKLCGEALVHKPYQS